MKKPEPPPMVTFIKGARVPTRRELLRDLLVTIVMTAVLFAIMAALR